MIKTSDFKYKISFDIDTGGVFKYKDNYNSNRLYTKTMSKAIDVLVDRLEYARRTVKLTNNTNTTSNDIKYLFLSAMANLDSAKRDDIFENDSGYAYQCSMGNSNITFKVERIDYNIAKDCFIE